MSQPRLGELLIAAGAITHEQLDIALGHQRHTGGKLGSNLVELGFIDEGRLAKVLSEQLHIPCATAAQIDRIKPEVLRKIGVGLAERLRVLPLREDAGKLWVAMADPTARKVLDEVQSAVGMQLRTMVCPELLIQYGLEKHYQVKRKLKSVEIEGDEGSGLIMMHNTSPDITTFAPQARPSEAPAYDPYAPQQGAPRAGAPPVPAPSTVDVGAGLKSLPKPGRISMDQLAEVLGRATKDEEVLDAALGYLSNDSRRVGLFLLRQARLEGFRGHGLDAAQLRVSKVTVDDLPLFQRTLQGGQTLIGGLDVDRLGILASLFGVNGPVLGVLVPVRIAQRPAGIFVCTDATLDDQRRSEYEHLALKIDWALHILQLRRLLLKRLPQR